MAYLSFVLVFTLCSNWVMIEHAMQKDTYLYIKNIYTYAHRPIHTHIHAHTNTHVYTHIYT